MITNSYLKVLLMLVIEWDLNSNGTRFSLMADSAHSISNSFIESEDAGWRLWICWWRLFVVSEVTVGFIVKISIDKRLFRVRDKAKKQFISKLQICQSPEIFKYAAALFILECLDDDDEQVVVFINDFKLEWIDQKLELV